MSALLAAVKRRSAPGQLPRKSTSTGNVVEQLKHLDAVTDCTMRGRRGPVTSSGSLGPCGRGRSPRDPFESRSVSMYPRCLYLRSSSMTAALLVVKTLSRRPLVCGGEEVGFPFGREVTTQGETLSGSMRNVVGWIQVCAGRRHTPKTRITCSTNLSAVEPDSLTSYLLFTTDQSVNPAKSETP